MIRTFDIVAKLTNEILGSWINEPNEMWEKMIGKKSADAARMAEEEKMLPAADLIEKGQTVFPRDTDGMPIILAYQLKGFFKAALNDLILILGDDGHKIETGRMKKKGTEAVALTTYAAAGVVDRFVHVTPDRIRFEGLPADFNADKLERCIRPLRAKTMQGDRVSVSCSESLPAGITFRFQVKTDLNFLGDHVAAMIKRGEYVGLNQWRTSGKGSFIAEVTETTPKVEAA